MKRVTRLPALSRRTMLRGLAGGAVATVALPMLEAMLDSHGEALASGAPIPKRFLTYHFGHGVILNRWVPAATGTGYALSPLLAPLAPVRDYVNVISGFKTPNQYYFCHIGGFSALWFAQFYSATPPGQPYDFRPNGPSHDQVAADHLSAGAPYRSLELSTSKRNPDFATPFLKHFSWKSKTQPNPAIVSPKAVFQKLFGVPPSDETRARRVSVLDAVKEDVASLQKNLGAFDRQKLEAHLEGVHQLQGQVAATAASLDVTEPTETNTDIAGKEPAQSVTDCFIDLIAHAYIGDLTRVVSWLGRPSFCSVFDSHLGHTSDNHSISHSGYTAFDEPKYHQAILWHVQMFSNLMQRLAAAQEGNQSILDRTVAMMGTDIAEGWTHSEIDIPCVIVGGAGLKRPGQHIRYLNRSTSDIGLTALRAVAPGIASVGPSTGHQDFLNLYSNTPISELLE